MDTASLLNICLKITGTFENGQPSYTGIVGDFDGAGLSVGILQWNPLSGTLQHLVSSIAAKMGWARAKAFFQEDIQAFAGMKPVPALAFVRAHFLDPAHPARLTPAATAAWTSLLGTPESQQAQTEYAQATVMAQAVKMAKKYVPEAAEHSRVIAFFFDVATQEGSMGAVPILANADGEDALAFAGHSDPACAALWTKVVTTDPLAAKLLTLGYRRALLGRSQYVWAAMSRRGVIACRLGICERTHFDFTALLD